MAKKPKKGSKKLTGAAREIQGQSRGPVDMGVLETLVQLMRAHDLTTVEVADGERRILLRRGGETVAAAPAAQKSAQAAATAAEAPADAGSFPIKSIMVGTFYSAANPDSAPFVKVGTHVDEDTDVCIIEAMKVFNTIKAECRGVIAKILVTNGQSVEFGQPLFLVKPE